MNIELYSGLEKFSCDMCHGLGERPYKTVRHPNGSKADICKSCYGKCLDYQKFNDGIKNGEIEVVDY